MKKHFTDLTDLTSI